MNIQNAIKNKVILITGGTGSFGNAVVERLLTMNPKQIIVFSRDEKKQFDMGNKFCSEKLKFITGDVRDKDSITHAMKDVDFVFHAAALKQVPNCEFFPLEAIKTNILGAHNVIDAAILNNVKRVVVLSTDKAVYPINVMGMTKAMMERIMVAASREKRGITTLCGTRYGNVVYTRGSVVPFFVDLMKKGKKLTITNKNMTRFLMPLRDSVDLVLYALTHGENGAMYVKKAPASTVGELAQSLVELFDYKKGFTDIGLRPGEKMHENFISTEEASRAIDLGKYYKISPEIPEMDYRKYYIEGEKKARLMKDGYTSANTKRLSIGEIKKLLLSLDEVQNELKFFKNKS